MPIKNDMPYKNMYTYSIPIQSQFNEVTNVFTNERID